MTWFKVDDSFHSHPKIAARSFAALGFWTVAGTWCGDHLTDGFVPDHMIPLLSRGFSELVQELVNSGLWERTKGGYRFHDWAAYQPTKEKVEHDRKAAAERQAALRERRKGTSRRESRVSNAVNNGVSHTTPTRPPLKGEGRQAPSKAHAFVEGTDGWCKACELPRINKIHMRGKAA